MTDDAPRQKVCPVCGSTSPGIRLRTALDNLCEHGWHSLPPGQEPEPDIYQQRYTAHQRRKAGTLASIIRQRYSDRVFGDGDVPEQAVYSILEAAVHCPSSCNRRGVDILMVRERDDKALLSGLLVGGTGWIHRAALVWLVYADPTAYKAPGEVAYMPYLDAGVKVGQMMLAATAHELAVAYCNPNIRVNNWPYFANRFMTRVPRSDGTADLDMIFCGAVAVGNRDPESPDLEHAARQAVVPRRPGDGLPDE